MDVLNIDYAEFKAGGIYLPKCTDIIFHGFCWKFGLPSKTTLAKVYI